MVLRFSKLSSILLIIFFSCNNPSEKIDNYKEVPFKAYDSLKINNKIYEDQFLVIDSLNGWYKMNSYALLNLKIFFAARSGKRMNIVYALAPSQSDSITLPFIFVQNEEYPKDLLGKSFDEIINVFETNFLRITKNDKYKNNEITYKADREKGIITVTTKASDQVFKNAIQKTYLLFHQTGSTNLILITDSIQIDGNKLDELLGNIYFKNSIIIKQKEKDTIK